MNKQRYTRLTLPAQSDKAPRGRTIIEHYFERCADTIDDYHDKPNNADTAYDLLALWSAKGRFHPHGLGRAAEKTVAKLDRIIEENKEDFVKDALTIPDPEAWLENCKYLSAKDFEEEHFDPQRYQSALRTLLADLDDVELVAYGARKLGYPDTDLEEQVQDCLAWVDQNPDFWLVLGSYVRAVGESFREDLPEFDPELALSAEKYITVLDALEDAMERLAYRNVAPLSGTVARSIVSAVTGVAMSKKQPRPHRIQKINLRPLRAPGLSLAASTLTETPKRQDLAFYVPELDCELLLILLPDQSIGVEVYSHDGHPSHELNQCEITTESGDLLYTINSPEGTFEAGSEIDHILLVRHEEVLELEPREESR